MTVARQHYEALKQTVNLGDDDELCEMVTKLEVPYLRRTPLQTTSGENESITPCLS